jgi:hypothetical protein
MWLNELLTVLTRWNAFWCCWKELVTFRVRRCVIGAWVSGLRAAHGSWRELIDPGDNKPHFTYRHVGTYYSTVQSVKHVRRGDTSSLSGYWGLMKWMSRLDYVMSAWRLSDVCELWCSRNYKCKIHRTLAYLRYDMCDLGYDYYEDVPAGNVVTSA